MNLFDEIDKDNKTTKGVFANEHDMKQYESDVENKMRTIEKKDQRFDLVSTASQVHKAELTAIKADGIAIEGGTPTANENGIAIEGETTTKGLR